MLSNQLRHKPCHGGFSLIELVIVIVIIGIIAAIAIPRMSRGAAGASDSALKANLSVLRNALDLYAAEHGGDYPTGANIKRTTKMDSTTGATTTISALTSYSDDAGDVQADKDTGTGATHIYGPYLRKIPPLPVGSHKGETDFTETRDNPGGWVYDAATGQVTANTKTSKTDATGKAYADY